VKYRHVHDLRVLDVIQSHLNVFFPGINSAWVNKSGAAAAAAALWL